MTDIVPELQDAIENTFRANLKNSKRIAELQEALEIGTANFGAADQYALEVGQALADAFHKHVSSGTLPDGKMYYNIAERVIPTSCRASHSEIADYAVAMVRGMNERAGLGIAPQSPKLNTDRIKGLVERACSADQYDDICKSFESDLVNYSQSVATDTLIENAEFQWSAGLSPVIHRTASANCCEWCADLAGDYPYEEVRETGSDVYRRHRDCNCEITFDPGSGRVQNVHTKRWSPKKIDIGIGVKVMNP